MRVGVHLGSQVPTEGGGATFTAEIWRALLSIAAESSHTFIAFGAGSVVSEVAGAAPNLAGIPIDWTLRSRLQGAGKRMARELLKSPASRRAAFRPPSRIATQISETAIDLLLCLTPEVPVLELPFITVVWDLQHRLQPWFPEVSAGGEWMRRELRLEQTLRRAAFVIAGTEAGKAEVHEFYGVPPDRIRIIPHPTPAVGPVAMEPREVMARYGIREPYLLYPAQLWPHKNHVTLLRALAALRDRRGVEVDCVLVGSDKGNAHYLRAVADDLDVQGRVHFLGFVPRADLEALYRSAAAMVYLSLFGPENLPPLEAFAAGCPVIAGAVSGAEEQLADAAILVDPRNPEAVADAVYRVLADESLRCRLVDRGHRRALRSTPESFVRDVLQLLDEFAPVRSCWAPAGASSVGALGRTHIGRTLVGRLRAPRW